MVNRFIHRTLGRFCLAGVLFALPAVLPAFAQQAPAAAPAPAVAPAAPLPPLAPSHLALGRELVTLSGLGKSLEPMGATIAGQLLQAYSAKRPSSAKDFEEILLSLKPDLDARKKDLFNLAAEAFARRIDEPALKEIVAFLKTPSGVKYTAATPAVLNAAADASDAWSKELATFMGTRVVEEMKKRGVDLGR